jgi:hypothetical protein
MRAFISKSELANDLRISPETLRRRMRLFESEFAPDYWKKKILTCAEVRKICHLLNLEEKQIDLILNKG